MDDKELSKLMSFNISNTEISRICGPIDSQDNQIMTILLRELKSMVVERELISREDTTAKLDNQKFYDVVGKEGFDFCMSHIVNENGDKVTVHVDRENLILLVVHLRRDCSVYRRTMYYEFEGNWRDWELDGHCMSTRSSHPDRYFAHCSFTEGFKFRLNQIRELNLCKPWKNELRYLCLMFAIDEKNGKRILMHMPSDVLELMGVKLK